MHDVSPIKRGFFAEASDALRQLMGELARETVLAEGDVLFEQGDRGDTFYVIEDGALEFSVLSADGRKLSLDVMHKGALFGEIALFDPGPRTATVTALERSRVHGVRNADVIAALRTDPDLGVDMIRLAGKRMRWMGFQLGEHVFLPLAARLARKVLHLTAHTSDPQPVLSLSQAELAEFAGASRESVSKTLAGWKRNGVIALNRGGMRVLNRNALYDLSDFSEI